MSIITRQKDLIVQLQDKLQQLATLAIYPDEVSTQDSTAHTLNLAIAGLKELLTIPMIREGTDFVVTGLETEHVFDSETYKLLASVAKVGLESPDQAPYQLKLIARILGIDGHQTEFEQPE